MGAFCCTNASHTFFSSKDKHMRAQVIFFSMLNLAEHDILDSHKYKNIKKFSFLLGSDEPRMLFFLLINVKIPTVVGILIFISWKSFIPS